MNKPTIVTAIIGGIDSPKPVPEQNTDFSRFDITLSPEGIKGNDRMKALYFKCNLLSLGFDSDIIIWLDGKIQPLSNDFVEQILQHMQGHEIAVLKHHERYCIYQEVDHIEHCMKRGNDYLLTRYKDKPIRKQVETYRYAGYPANAGLWDCSIIAVRNTDTMRDVLADWWKDVYERDGFDQTALPFYCWKRRVIINPIIFKPGSYDNVPHIKMK